MKNESKKLNELANYINKKLEGLDEFRAYSELKSICEDNGILLMDLDSENEQ